MQVDNDASLDFVDDLGPVNPQHYAFLVDEPTSTTVLGRIRCRGLQYWADPGNDDPQNTTPTTGGRGVYLEEPSGHFREVITRPYGSGT